MEYPFKIKDSIEHKGYLTGAHSGMLLADLKQGCGASKFLEVPMCPATALFSDRGQRPTETRSAEDLYPGTRKAREIMQEELELRLFDERPSYIRLVQMYMSKQRRPETWLPAAWLVLAKSLYLSYLRRAAILSAVGVRTSPRKSKQAKKADRGLFRNMDSGDDSEAEPVASDADEDAGSDTVMSEVSRWTTLDRATVNKYKDADSLVNKFALMFELRAFFPLHYFLFRQTACHIAHEANTEQLFSLSGRLSDPNLNPLELGILAKISSNGLVYRPPYTAILARYLQKFSKKNAGGGSGDENVSAGDALEDSI